uniref:Odorant receptor, family F, subfamily 115, member 15 n=1 Tax=Neogobius melanostomus TaxID=47308 RepID=A0A8C6T7B7_9GOBI
MERLGENHSEIGLWLQLEGFLLSHTSHTILMIMAFDHYVAICDPLKYSSIMSGRMLLKLTLLAWGGAFLLILILFVLTMKLTRCRSFITGLYCSNAALFKLSCENTIVQNILGLLSTSVVLAMSIGMILLTYTRITLVCVTNHSSSLNRRALQTCSTHLTAYILLVSGLSIVAMQRFSLTVEVRKVLALLKDLVPGSLNPIIYGLQSKEIRRIFLWRRHKRSPTERLQL